MRKRTLPLWLMLLAGLALQGSGAVGSFDAQAFASDQAILVELSFDGELIVDQTWNEAQTIEDQLLFTVGQLNGDRSVGRLDAIELSRVRSARVGNTTRIRYHAVLPVAWGDRRHVPHSYALRLPRRVDYSAIDAFANRYKDLCTDFGAHDVDGSSMWYYYRPRRPLCVMKPADVVDLNATVRVAKQNTTGKYPEYSEVWKDNALDVVAIFGKYEQGATYGDAGIDAYNAFVAAVKQELGPWTTTVPTPVPTNPGVASPDIVFTRTDGATRTTITALLVDDLGDSTFRERYPPLSRAADLIIYNGHWGLGGSVQNLYQAGSFIAGKYVIVFIDAVDSFVFFDQVFASRRSTLNADDASGTKYMDVVTNAMPAFFASMAPASLALVRGLMTPLAPRTYERILRNIDTNQIAVVMGEEDNAFQPHPDDGPVANWMGMTEAVSVSKNEERHFETPFLSAGQYTFTMTHDPEHPGGDADLYVRIGQLPTTATYDCRPYKSGSNEECQVQLAAPAQIFVVVRGYSTQSSVLLNGRRGP